MWIVKGVLVGLAAFIPLSIVYLIVRLGPSRRGVATSVGVLKLYTMESPIFWTVFVVLMVLGCLLTRHWQKA